MGVLLCYKTPDDRGRLKLLLNGWSCCKTRWIYHLHGLLRSLLGSFLSRQLWGQRCGSNAVGSVDICKTSFFTNFCQEILQLVLPHGYITKPDINFWTERACIVVFRFLSKRIASWISFCQVLLKASHRTTRISRPCHHYRLTLVFVVAYSSGMIFRRSLA